MTGEELERRRSEGEQEGVVEKKRNQRKIRGGRASFIEVETGRTQGRPGSVFASRGGVSQSFNVYRTTRIVRVDHWRAHRRSGSA